MPNLFSEIEDLSPRYKTDRYSVALTEFFNVQRCRTPLKLHDFLLNEVQVHPQSCVVFGVYKSNKKEFTLIQFPQGREMKYIKSYGVNRLECKDADCNSIIEGI